MSPFIFYAVLVSVSTFSYLFVGFMLYALMYHFYREAMGEAFIRRRSTALMVLFFWPGISLAIFTKHVVIRPVQRFFWWVAGLVQYLVGVE